MSLTEILAAIPKLSFAERQELVRRAIEIEDHDLTAEEKAILDQRLEDFRQNPNSGITAQQLKAKSRGG
jgi:putative addiction module component (TIGR02574 family)